MKTLFGKCFFSILVLAGVALAPAGSPNVSPVLAAPASDPICVLTWKPVPAPSPSTESNILSDTSFASASDGWAVGFWTEQGQQRALIEHWDGALWSIVTIPPLPAPNNQLNSVTAISADDVWAVGSYWLPADNPDHQPLLLHWDGNSWSYVPAPTANGWLKSISATASDDVWAVGSTRDGYHSGTPLLFHWNGQTWATLTPPEIFDPIQVAARTSDDVWVLSQGMDIAQILHWNGAAWSVHSTFPLPKETEFDTRASGLAVLAPNDIWVVGYQYTSAWVTRRIPEAFHWDGAQWDTISPPVSSPTSGFVLTDVAGFSSGRLIAVGTTSFAQWNGVEWNAYYFPPVLDAFIEIESITALDEDNVWAVGGGTDAVIMHGTLPCRAAPSFPPALASPPDGAILTQVRPTLEWASTPDTDFYRLKLLVHPAAYFIQEIIPTPAQPPSFAIYYNLSEGAHTWAVQSCNYMGCSLWSESRTFTTENYPPPLLNEPPSHQVLSTHMPTFGWSSIPLPAIYHLELIRYSPDGPVVGTIEVANQSSYQWTEWLPRGTYFWRMWACVLDVCTLASEASEFIIENRPRVPVLFTPFDGETIQPSGLTLDWKEMPRARFYRIQIWRGSPNGKPFIKSRSRKSEYLPQLLTPLQGGYTWRVKACNQAGCSQWSSSRVFYIQ